MKLELELSTISLLLASAFLATSANGLCAQAINPEQQEAIEQAIDIRNTFKEVRDDNGIFSDEQIDNLETFYRSGVFNNEPLVGEQLDITQAFCREFFIRILFELYDVKMQRNVLIDKPEPAPKLDPENYIKLDKLILKLIPEFHNDLSYDQLTRLLKLMEYKHHSLESMGDNLDLLLNNTTASIDKIKSDIELESTDKKLEQLVDMKRKKVEIEHIIAKMKKK